jgi:hypothetical protein
MGLLIASCDPLRRINMKNKSAENASIIWTLKERDSLYKSPFFISNSKITRFDLKPSKPYNEVKMSFGLGSWTRDSLAMITDRLETLEIISGTTKIKIDSSKNIYDYLLARRKGLGKKRIEIVISR